MYLTYNTCPDLTYNLNQCGRFQCDPHEPHENSIKCIKRCLIVAKDKGCSFKPTNKLSNFEWFFDNFSGNYTKETFEDPHFIKSRTGCIIKYVGCPTIWFRHLQTEIIWSTTEAEYLPLSTAAREVFPLREMITELKPILNIPDENLVVTCTLFEDNKGVEN